MHRLLRLTSLDMRANPSFCKPQCRSPSPCSGSSILTTSAPKSARYIDAIGPASRLDRSRTRTSARGRLFPPRPTSPPRRTPLLSPLAAAGGLDSPTRASELRQILLRAAGGRPTGEGDVEHLGDRPRALDHRGEV